MSTINTNHTHKPFVLIFLLFISCLTPNEQDNSINSTLTVEYNRSCGWCGGSQYLTINGKVANYNFPAICDMEAKHSEKILSNEELKQLQLAELVKLVRNIESNDCGVCVDGCDESISYTEKEESHSIRFTSTDSIPEIENYLAKLRNLMIEMRELSE